MTKSDAQELLARGLAAITKNSVLRVALKSGTDALPSERERLEKEEKALNDEKAASVVKRADFAKSVERYRLMENARDHVNEDVYYAAQAINSLHKSLEHRRVEAHKLKPDAAGRKEQLKIIEGQLKVSTKLASGRREELQ